jgi:hypothetical protein
MLSIARKKENEKRVLQYFLDFNKLSESVRNVIDYEKPDFLFDFDSRKVGVELTSLYNNVESKKRKHLISKLLITANTLYQAVDSEPLNISIDLKIHLNAGKTIFLTIAMNLQEM